MASLTCSKRAARAALVAVLTVVCSATRTEAEEVKAAPDAWVPRGRNVWGFAAGGGVADGDRAGGSVSLSLIMSRTLTEPVGPGWLRGRIGVVVEMVPLFLLSQDSTTYGAGFNLIGRHDLSLGSKLRPFITLGAGMILSAKEIPDGVANVNFTPQVGFGLAFSDSSRHVYSFEIRLHHISNGGRVEPNPGINSIAFQLTVLFPGRD